LICTQDLVRMAAELGVNVDVSMLQFWQRRGLIPLPVRCPGDGGQGAPDYYDRSLLRRVLFIHQALTTYSMRTGAVQQELAQIDERIAQVGLDDAAAVYEKRLAELRSQREVELREAIVRAIVRLLDVSPEEIVAVTVRMKNGASVHVLADQAELDRSGDLQHVWRDLPSEFP
jgi:DNA-binding transcriptional MerR regulator